MTYEKYCRIKFAIGENYQFVETTYNALSQKLNFGLRIHVNGYVSCCVIERMTSDDNN